MVSRVQYSFMTPGANGADLGAFVTIVYSAECVASQKKSRPATLLPLLVILFLVSYGILTLLVFEQGRTIEAQRLLIRGMLQDSTQLASLKGKLARDESNRSHDMAAAQAEHKDADSGSRSTGNPATGNAAADSRSTGNPAAGAKGSDKQTKRPSKSARSTKEAPGKPASDLTDVRRSTRVI
jgi:cytoskeletal protein RodZ